MTDEFTHRRMISWAEIASLMKIKGMKSVQPQWLPGVGHFIALEGTEKAVAEGKARLKRNKFNG
jgi:hypothetical protein